MTEQRIPSLEDKKLSRREFVGASGASMGALAMAWFGNKLINDGFVANKYPISIENRMMGKMEMVEDEAFGPESGSLLTSGGDLIYIAPSGSSFEDIRYAHRTNRFDDIDEAIRMGASVVDVDANTRNGKVYAEHGKIVGFKNSILGIFDMNERRFEVGSPKNLYEDVIRYISHQVADWPVGVFTELKRGDFDFSEIYHMMKIHHDYGVSVRMYGQGYDDRLLDIAHEMALISQNA